MLSLIHCDNMSGGFLNIWLMEVNWPINSCVAILQRSSMIVQNKLALFDSSSFYPIKFLVSYNFFSLQVLEMISVLSMPEFCRSDLGDLLKGVQAHEKEKLHLVSYLGHSLCYSVDHEITLP